MILYPSKKYLSIYSNQSFNKNSEFDEDEINDYTLSFNEDLHRYMDFDQCYQC